MIYIYTMKFGVKKYIFLLTKALFIWLKVQ